MADHDEQQQAQQAQDDFLYTGGEFEGDAPYDEALHGIGAASHGADEGAGEEGGGGGDSIESLLASLLGSASLKDDDPDTCFSINAAASFAAILNPEEQISEVAWEVLDVETLINVVDVLTPLEVMQVALFLHCFSIKEQHSLSLPPSLRSTPLFCSCATCCGPLTRRWVLTQERSLMQALSILGVGLNREQVQVAEEVEGEGYPSSSTPALYSLLHRGSKISALSSLQGVLSDLGQLLVQPDVLQFPTVLYKQLVQQAGDVVVQAVEEGERVQRAQRRRQGKEGSNGAEAAAACEPVSSQLRDRFAHLNLQPSQDSTGSFSLDLEQRLFTYPSLPSPSSSSTYLLPLQQLLSSSSSQPAVLYAQLFVFSLSECSRAVWEGVAQFVRGSQLTDAPASAPSFDPSSHAHALLLLLHSLTADSPFASLLTPDSTQAEQPTEFFLPFVLAGLEQLAANPKPADETATEAAAPAPPSLLAQLRLLAPADLATFNLQQSERHLACQLVICSQE